MFADINYYQNEFKGTQIKTADEYEYLSREASRYIMKYTKEVDDDTKACECALVEYLDKSNKQGNMTSESIPNFYSVSWSANDKATRTSKINAILELYLGDKYSSVGIVKLIG